VATLEIPEMADGRPAAGEDLDRLHAVNGGYPIMLRMEKFHVEWFESPKVRFRQRRHILNPIVRGGGAEGNTRNRVV